MDAIKEYLQNTNKVKQLCSYKTNFTQNTIQNTLYLNNRLAVEQNNAKDSERNTPLHLAIEKDCLDLIEYLVNK